ncbi:MAG TPA: leucyl aminopeptidase [Dokdonella sp.]|uniref:leucyl aminopeptidase n=1 Tax=Dokdonella sp. TaxID=2291710 RepID=UPI0025BCDC55|nr:leucyl aminopeptidase [Dokdonella sp.]MBX3690825.1 leucyl aminopeptidase [Dokdonella sp.]HNR91283.1 leucyl aminopeptidase [Dokdonella sp.]
MTLKFSQTTATPDAADVDCAIVGVFEDRSLSAAAARVDEASGGAIRRLIDSGDITGKIGSHALLHALPGIKAARVLVAGLGDPRKFDGAALRRATRDALAALRNSPVTSLASWLTELEVPGRDEAWKLRIAALAADHQNYRYTATFKSKDGTRAATLKSLALAGRDGAHALAEAEAIALGVRFARELGNLPPNICNPAHIAAQAQAFADSHDGVTCEVLEREAMQALGMGALLGVAQGSANAPKLIVLRWNGAGNGIKPYALVGKGITFDTGGISIKPGAGMEEMKFDMCGAAGVLGAFVAAVELKLPLNLVCIVAAVENMPDGNAYRPGDVLTSMSGTTIEVLNTDAEGRLILCDALTYAQRFDPQVIIDAATLTGACVVALGKHASGLMSADDELAAQLVAAGEASLDRAWRLPLWDDYQSQLESGFADVANIGGKYAGAITAGCFLSRFTNGQRWAHLDVAGTAWDEGRKGLATGRPVPLLVQYLVDRCT